MSKRYRILLFAYACEPGKGSEPGVGWYWATNLASHCDVTVLTDQSHQAAISACKPCPSLQVVYVATARFWVRLLRPEKEGLRRMLHYLLWQFSAYRAARKLTREQSFDVLHHVTYSQYRTPASGMFLDQPFVFGPVGGGECIPYQLYRDLAPLSIVKDIVRRLSGCALRTYLALRGGSRRTAVIFANKATQQLASLKSKVPQFELAAIFFERREDFQMATTKLNPSPGSPLRIAMAGRFLDWKGYSLALSALAVARSQGCPLEVVVMGAGPFEKKMRREISAYGLSEIVTLLGSVPLSRVREVFRGSDLVLYAAFRDSGAMVVTDAYSEKTPALVLDIPAHSKFEAAYTLKVPLGKTYAETVARLGKTIAWCSSHKEELEEFGKAGFEAMGQSLSWQYKWSLLREIYASVQGEDPNSALIDAEQAPSQLVASEHWSEQGH